MTTLPNIPAPPILHGLANIEQGLGDVAAALVDNQHVLSPQVDSRLTASMFLHAKCSALRTLASWQGQQLADSILGTGQQPVDPPQVSRKDDKNSPFPHHNDEAPARLRQFGTCGCDFAKLAIAIAKSDASLVRKSFRLQYRFNLREDGRIQSFGTCKLQIEIIQMSFGSCNCQNLRFVRPAWTVGRNKKEIVGLAVPVKKPFDKRDGIVVISHAAPIGDMPTRIDKLLVDFNSCVFFRLQFVHPTSRFDAADCPVNVQPVTSASTAYFVTNYIKIGDVQGMFGCRIAGAFAVSHWPPLIDKTTGGHNITLAFAVARKAVTFIGAHFPS